MLTAEDLIAFEDDIAKEFEAGNIRAPVHLAGGNERKLIKIFEEIGPYDWICCAWRAHYHALLRGVPAYDLKKAIMAGRSIALCFPAYRVISSAIVGGIAPIAVGLAWSIKQRQATEKVWVFIGDMTSRSGIYSEASRYAGGHELPIRWVVEDNGLSVVTDTKEVWGKNVGIHRQTYQYEMTRPHVGIGKFVKF